jgi:hypothetical protein
MVIPTWLFWLTIVALGCDALGLAYRALADKPLTRGQLAMGALGSLCMLLAFGLFSW